MAKKTTLLFEGVNVSKNFLTGTVSSNDLTDNFSKDWIPAYQRDRIQNKKKITELIEIFRTSGHIDAIKICVRGEYTIEGDHLLVEGFVSIIDGQQRVMSLIDSGVHNIRIPIELYLNLSIEEEVKLFHQFNRSATKLTFGELAKSTEGAYADLLKKIMKRGDKYPVPVSVNSNYTGLSLSVIASLMNYVERAMIHQIKLKMFATGKPLLRFLETDDVRPVDVNMVDFALKNLLQLQVDISGTFDVKAIAYRRAVLLAFAKLMVGNFLTDTGKFELGKFRPRVMAMPSKLYQNARFKENSSGGNELVIELETLMVNYLNHGLHKGLLPLPNATADDVNIELNVE